MNRQPHTRNQLTRIEILVIYIALVITAAIIATIIQQGVQI